MCPYSSHVTGIERGDGALAQRVVDKRQLAEALR
jgi:hypothetical protein